MSEKIKPNIRYASNEIIKPNDVVLSLTRQSEFYEFLNPIMKVWDIVTTNDGQLIGVALMPINASSPAIFLRVKHNSSEAQQNNYDKFGDIPGGYITTRILVDYQDINILLSFLFRMDEIIDIEDHSAFIQQRIDQRASQNDGLALLYKAKSARQHRNFDEYNEGIEKAAKLNFTPALCELSQRLFNDYNIKDDQRSFKVCEHASNMGDPIATVKLAGYYARGTGIEANIKRSAKLLRQSSSQGCWEATLGLALYYRFGWLVSLLSPSYYSAFEKVDESVIDPDKAFFLLSYIVDQAPEHEGDVLARAEYYLAWLYQDGFGVTQNYAEAVKLYESALNRGNLIAASNLAKLYELGLGTEQNLEYAFELYTTAVDRVIVADLALGKMYLRGQGTDQNLELAQQHLEKVLNSRIDMFDIMINHDALRQEAWELLESFAKDTFYQRVQNILKQPELFSFEEIDDTKQQTNRTFIPLTLSCEIDFKLNLELANREDHSAKLSVGQSYLKGIGTSIDLELAHFWIVEAFNQKKNEFANYMMGHLYEHGIGVSQNLKKAYKFYKKSLTTGIATPKKINGKPNPKYIEYFNSFNEQSLVAIARVESQLKQSTPKWMFWKS